MSKQGIAEKIIFGGPGGSFSPINDTGEQVIIFKAGTRLDSIQIGDRKYGGDKGTEQARAVFPRDGTFTLVKLQCNGTQCINYFEAIIGGNTVKVGTYDKTAGTLSVHLRVSLSGVNSGSAIDSLQFNIIPIS